MVWEYAYPEARRGEGVRVCAVRAGLRLQTLRRLPADRGGPDAAGPEDMPTSSGSTAPVVAEMKTAVRRRHSYRPAVRLRRTRSSTSATRCSRTGGDCAASYLTQFYRELRAGPERGRPDRFRLPCRSRATGPGPAWATGTSTGGRGSTKDWSMNWSCRSCSTVTKATGPQANPEDFGYLDGQCPDRAVRDFIRKAVSRPPV